MFGVSVSDTVGFLFRKEKMEKLGWIKLHRRLLDNKELRMSDNAFRLFVSLLLLVDKDTGQWSGGRFQLAQQVGLKKGSTYKTLKRLESRAMVTLSSNNRYTTISICNWGKYQHNSSHDSRATVTTESQQGHTLTRRENKEERNIYTKKWFLNDVDIKEFQNDFSKKDVTSCYESAKDWVVSTGKTYKDYKAFFRNWLRRSPDTNKSIYVPVNMNKYQDRERETINEENLEKFHQLKKQMMGVK